MKSKFIWKLISLLIISILSAALICLLLSRPDRGYVPYLKVAGDVKNVLHFNNFEKSEKSVLKNIIDKAVPGCDEYEVLLVGNDGLLAMIDNRTDGTYLNFSNMNGWEILNDNHPVSSQIKHLKEIIVVSRDQYSDNSVIIFDTEKNITSVTPGQLYEKGLMRTLSFKGRSNIKRDSGEYSVSVFSTELIYPLKELNIPDNLSYMIIDGNGKNHYTRSLGFLAYKDNRIDYLDADKKNEIKDVKGILTGAPALSNSGAYHDALRFIEDGKKVMVIFLDGFSYAQYEYAINNGYAPYLAGFPKAENATTYYKPVTNVGFAGMITGTGPDENGIHDRSYRNLKSSIFTVLKEKGFKSLLIEADVNILDSGADTKLNLDRNKNGGIDDEVFEAAVKEAQNGYDYIMVHFHKIDDLGHSYGPLAKETLDQISTSDKYVEELAKNFDGKIIVTADHGMHKTETGGSHGQARFEDFIVPYFIIEGGIKK
jgi:hypothetical protein